MMSKKEVIFKIELIFIKLIDDLAELTIAYFVGDNDG